MEEKFYGRNEEKPFIIEDKKSIFEARKNFETRLRNNISNNISDFKDYIAYEIILWNRTHDKTVTSKIIKLHKQALSYYKTDLKLWLSYIKFCMKTEHRSLVTEAFAQMLLCHNNKELWILAARWELEENDNADKSLHYLYEGLNHYPQSTEFYLEIIQTELKYSKSAESETKSIKLLQVAQIEFPNQIDLYLNLINILNEFPDKLTLQTNLVKYMIETFTENESVWCCLAKRELNGFHLTDTNDYLYNASLTNEERFQHFVNVYKRAVKLNPSEQMWSLYLTNLLDLKDIYDYTSAFKEACLEAHRLSVMCPEYYVSLINLCDDNLELKDILREASEHQPKSERIWLARLQYHMKRDDNIEVIFQQALRELGDDSFQIWLWKVQYIQMKSSEAVASIYRQALEYSPSINVKIKPLYLQWIASFKSIDKTRDEYKLLSIEQPFCLQLHEKMAELESKCVKPNEEVLETILRLVTEQFGQDIWLNYVQKEISNGPQWKNEMYTKYFLNKMTKAN